MGVEKILQEIESGLTGDRKQDAVYLWRQAKRYKLASQNEIIINEISRKLFSLIPGINEALLL